MQCHAACRSVYSVMQCAAVYCESEETTPGTPHTHTPSSCSSHPFIPTFRDLPCLLRVYIRQTHHQLASHTAQTPFASARQQFAKPTLPRAPVSAGSSPSSLAPCPTLFPLTRGSGADSPEPSPTGQRGRGGGRIRLRRNLSETAVSVGLSGLNA